MNKELAEFPLSIKLVKDIKMRKFYLTNYCEDLCAQNEHKYQRQSVPVHYFIKTETIEFELVLSIDMSCLTIDEELLVAIIKNCPQLECLIINKTVFENQKSWDYFCTQLIGKLKPRSHLAIDNQIFIKENGGKRLLNDFQLLFSNWKNPEAMKVYFNQRRGGLLSDNGRVFAESFKFVGELDFFHLNHFSNERCFDDCLCKVQTQEKINQLKQQLFVTFVEIRANTDIKEIMKHMKQSAQHSESPHLSNTIKILKQVKQNSPNLKYFRLHTDMCVYEVDDTIQLVSKFKQLIAVHLDLNNTFFDLFNGNDLKPIFQSIINSSLKGLSIIVGQYSTDLFLLCRFPPQITRNMTTLKLTGSDLDWDEENQEHLFEKLKSYKNLETLALSDCQVPLKELPRFILSFKHLKTLIIESNDFNVKEFEELIKNSTDYQLTPIEKEGLNYSHLTDLGSKMERKVKIKIFQPEITKINSIMSNKRKKELTEHSEGLGIKRVKPFPILRSALTGDVCPTDDEGKCLANSPLELKPGSDPQ